MLGRRQGARGGTSRKNLNAVLVPRCGEEEGAADGEESRRGLGVSHEKLS
jgi:hypothetical protein